MKLMPVGMFEFREFPTELAPGTYGTIVGEQEERNGEKVIPIFFAPDVSPDRCHFPVTIGI